MEEKQSNFSYQITNEDCLELLSRLPDHSVDMVLCDPPYSITRASWDKGLNWPEIWHELKRVVKPNGAKLFFTASLFHYHLVQSNFQEFRYRFIWAKNLATNFLMANRMPLRKTEEIAVFFTKQPEYHPCIIDGYVRARHNYAPTRALWDCKLREINIPARNKRYTTDLLEFKTASNDKRLHITQKPIDLLEFLIKTYSSEGDTILDFCMGSGSTGEACYHTKRHFIGCELSPDFFTIAKTRLELLPYPDRLDAFIKSKPLKQLKLKVAQDAINEGGGQNMHEIYPPQTKGYTTLQICKIKLAQEENVHNLGMWKRLKYH